MKKLISKSSTGEIIKLFEKCNLEWYFWEGKAYNQMCDVRFTGSVIAVSYKDQNGDYAIFKGKRTGKGHYELTAPEINGKATLHRGPRTKILEGYWQEDDDKGMWRIHLY